MNNNFLFEINRNILPEINELICKALESSEGEIDTETGLLLDSNFLENIQIPRKDALESLLLYSEQLKGEASILDVREKAIYQRKKAKQNEAERVKRFVQSEMERFGDKRLDGEQIRATWCDGRESLKYEPDKIPQEFIYTETVTKVDTESLKKRLQSGEVIDGAWIEKTPYLIIK